MGEMDGKVVSAGIVPDKLCTPEALSKVNKVKNQLHLTGAGNIYPYCCDFDLCNSDMCTAMNLPAGNSNNNNEVTEKALASLQSAGLGGSLTKNACLAPKPILFSIYLGCTLIWLFQ